MWQADDASIMMLLVIAALCPLMERYSILDGGGGAERLTLNPKLCSTRTPPPSCLLPHSHKDKGYMLSGQCI